MEAAGTEIILASLEHGVLEGGQQRLEHGQVFANQLFLQIDGVRADDRLFGFFEREENRRHQVGQALAHARARLDQEVFAADQRARHRHRHALLLGAVLEIARFREHAGGGKHLLDLIDQIGHGPRGWSLGDANHGAGRSPRGTV